MVDIPVVPTTTVYIQVMATRLRTRLIGGNANPQGVGYPQFAGPATQYKGPYALYSEETTDEDNGNFSSTNPFNCLKRTRVVCVVNGKTSAWWRCENWPILMDDMDVTVQSISGLPSDSVAATTALARANPSRPHVDVLNFVYELKDIPRMIRDIGFYQLRGRKGFNLSWQAPNGADPKAWANAILSWEFGWKPLISDLMKLLNWSAVVDRRMDELARLRAGDLRKTITTFDASELQAEGPSPGVIMGPSYQNTAYARFRWYVTQKQWVRIRYKPTASTLVLLGDDMRSVTNDLLLGVGARSLSLSTVWNAIPWSWLIDWFTTAGDYFAASRNTLGVVVDDVAVMRRTTAYPRMRVTANSLGASMALQEGAFWDRKLRARHVGGPVVTSSVQLLSARQWSILSSLAVMNHHARWGVRK